MDRLCVYCGSSIGARPAYRDAATELGRTLADRGIGLVYGGGDVGLMGAVADATLDAGGEAHGVIPASLVDAEVAHDGLTELDVVDSMHARKQRMVDLADGFVALPGGFGTLEELTEVLTWTQLGLHDNPCGLLNVADYYADLAAFFDHQVTEEFVSPAHRAMVIVENDPEALLDRFAEYEAPPLKDVLDSPDET
ncbi:TIGR00730 family Rossman fold protein [Halococcus salsus]|uniref:LOG family protein n=1 Tax=Halococcus salsus TaxID=2162894 RepID=UPI00135C966B|nr:TIGR00730 family Rossman fold protein [Halococcus salsus]